MRFPLVFKRSVGSATYPTLGSDSAPVTQAYLTNDNVLNAAAFNSFGLPVKRIVVGLSAPGGASNLLTSIYLFEETSGMWFLMHPAVSITPGSLNYFDVTNIANSSKTNAGSLEVAVVAAAAGGDPSGTYLFAIGPEVGGGW